MKKDITRNIIERKQWFKPTLYILNYKKTEGGTTAHPDREDVTYIHYSE